VLDEHVVLSPTCGRRGLSVVEERPQPHRAEQILGGRKGVGRVVDNLGAVDAPNGGIVLDTWHLAKSGVDFDELDRIDLDHLTWAELNDGYANPDMGRTEETTNHRLLPGDGEFDVSGFVRGVRETGYDSHWGVEVLNRDLRTLPMDELYTQTYEKTRVALVDAR
jgi:sugar phosphate isomerase/epimerase